MRARSTARRDLCSRRRSKSSINQEPRRGPIARERSRGLPASLSTRGRLGGRRPQSAKGVVAGPVPESRSDRRRYLTDLAMPITQGSRTLLSEWRPTWTSVAFAHGRGAATRSNGRRRASRHSCPSSRGAQDQPVGAFADRRLRTAASGIGLLIDARSSTSSLAGRRVGSSKCWPASRHVLDPAA